MEVEKSGVLFGRVLHRKTLFFWLRGLRRTVKSPWSHAAPSENIILIIEKMYRARGVRFWNEDISGGRLLHLVTNSVLHGRKNNVGTRRILTISVNSVNVLHVQRAFGAVLPHDRLSTMLHSCGKAQSSPSCLERRCLNMLTALSFITRICHHL